MCVHNMFSGGHRHENQEQNAMLKEWTDIDTRSKDKNAFSSGTLILWSVIFRWVGVKVRDREQKWLEYLLLLAAVANVAIV